MGTYFKDNGRIGWPSHVNVGLALCRVIDVGTKESKVKGVLAKNCTLCFCYYNKNIPYFWRWALGQENVSGQR